MLPDIDLRLQNAMKALVEVVLPALPASEPLACEQGKLVLAHLGVIARQWKAALKFELGTYDALSALAETLSAGAREPAQTQLIEQALAASAGLDRTDYDAVSAAQRALAAAVAGFIEGDAMRVPLPRDVFDAVLTYSERQALRERAWFAACGIDPDADTLPALASVLEG